MKLTFFNSELKKEVYIEQHQSFFY